MNQKGYVYALINPNLDGLVKIGKTTRTPEERAKELSSSTGIPTPFYVGYKILVNDCHKAEEYMHVLLSSEGFRVSDNREFFQISLNDAVDLMREVQFKFDLTNIDSTELDSADLFNDEFLDDLCFDDAAKSPWSDIEGLANNYYYGTGDELQDYDEAYRLFKQAAALGSITACITLSEMHEDGDGCKASIKKSLKWLKNGASIGGGICFGYMAVLFVENDNQQNAEKCWRKYFKSDDFWRYNPGYDLKEMSYLSQLKSGQIDNKFEDLLTSIKHDVLEKAYENRNVDLPDSKRKYQGLVHFFNEI